ncbi:hypothetical protein [Flavobacterium suncheonense]|uniref:Lipoprotein n=1 Tax=Flavobacterium suncheonense GH29-5 = DSM 17707 TaxID=1121899 RepID=A0A0A2M4C4_9FLAO|nr:hypothetical protein [Flavobacterium suncheonense]KGO87507.1 hypothetical protein Q764_12865 [Flavobacterium suncheonense GH29-5 = DSM 17707]
MRKKSIALIILSSLLGGCLISHGQNLEKDSLKIQKYINKKFSTPIVFRITEKAKVDQIDAYITKKIALKAKKEADEKAKYDAAIGRRYMLGDKSTIPAIVEILESKNKDSIDNLFVEMDRGYKEIRTSFQLDQPVKNAVFNLITNEELEHLVVQYLGYNNIEGHTALFEDRLLSGKSTDNERLFYWLGNEAKSEKAIDYVIKLSQNSNASPELHWIREGISGYMEKGSENSKKKILNLAYDYIDKNPIKREDFKKPSEENFYSAYVLKLVLAQIIVENGDGERAKKIISSLEQLIHNEPGDEDTKRVLLKGIDLFKLRYKTDPEKVEAIKPFLSDSELYFEALETIKKDKFLFENETIKNLVLSNFEKLGFQDDYYSQKLIDFYKGLEKAYFYNLADKNIQSEPLKIRLKKEFDIDNKTFEEINNDLHMIGIIDRPISQEQIEIYKQKEFANDDLNSIHTCLDIAKISLAFDVEASTIPVDYDVLLADFASISNHKISGIKSYLQFKWNEDENKGYYQFLVHYKNNCYVMIPEDSGDWYDMETFNKLLDLIVEDTGIKENFYSVYTGDQTAFYLFGEKEKINLLKEKYNLEANDEEGLNFDENEE